MKGTVKFFNRNKGFGFISGDDGKEYFVHVSGISGGELQDNDSVTFDVEQGDRGPKAVNVSKGDGGSSDSASDSDDSSSDDSSGSDDDSQDSGDSEKEETD